MSTEEKSPCKTVNIDKESSCQVKFCKKLTPCPAKGSKKASATKWLKMYFSAPSFQ